MLSDQFSSVFYTPAAGLFLSDPPKATSTQKENAEEALRLAVKYTQPFEDFLREFAPWMATDEAAVARRRIDILIFHVWMMRLMIEKLKRVQAYLCYLFMKRLAEDGMPPEQVEEVRANAEASMVDYQHGFLMFMGREDIVPISREIVRKVANGGAELSSKPVTHRLVLGVGAYFQRFMMAAFNDAPFDVPAIRAEIAFLGEELDALGEELGALGNPVVSEAQ